MRVVGKIRKNYYFRLEDHIPEDHLLRLINQHIDFAFVRESLKQAIATPVVLRSIQKSFYAFC